MVVAAGYFVLANLRTGAIATAGAAAAALGVPPADVLPDLRYERSRRTPRRHPLRVRRRVAGLLLRRTQPRPALLPRRGLIGLCLAVLQATENVFDAPFLLRWGFFGASQAAFDSTGSGGRTSEGGLWAAARGSPFTSWSPPHRRSVLGFRVAFLLVGRWLDRSGGLWGRHPLRGRRPAALPGGRPGPLARPRAGRDRAAHGADRAGPRLPRRHRGRRLTTWVGGAATALGAAIFLADMTDDASIGGCSSWPAASPSCSPATPSLRRSMTRRDGGHVGLVSVAAGPLRQVRPHRPRTPPTRGPGRRRRPVAPPWPRPRLLTAPTLLTRRTEFGGPSHPPRSDRPRPDPPPRFGDPDTPTRATCPQPQPRGGSTQPVAPPPGPAGMVLG